MGPLDHGAKFAVSLYRADTRFWPSQCETWLLCNNVSHWLGANLESVLKHNGGPCGTVSALGWPATHRVNSLRSSLVQVIAWCRAGTKLLPEPMMIYRQLSPWKQTSEKFVAKYKHFLLTKFTSKCCLQTGNHFSPLRHEQNGWKSVDNIFKCILSEELFWALVEIWLKFVLDETTDKLPLVQVKAWCS